MFQFVEQELLRWPSEHSSQSSDVIIEISRLIRQQCWLQAEALCLLQLALVEKDHPQQEIYRWLLCLLYLNSLNHDRAKEVYFDSVSSLFISLPWFYIRLRLFAADQNFFIVESRRIDTKLIEHLSSSFDPKSFFSSYACLLNGFVLGKSIDDISASLYELPNKDTLEYVRMHARLLSASANPIDALALLEKYEQKCGNNYGYWIQFCEAALVAQDPKLSLHSLRRLQAILGDHPRVLPLLLQVELLQRKPASARRSTLLLRTAKSADLLSLNTSTAASNQLTSYEYCGNVGWFPYLLPQYISGDNTRTGDGVPNMIYHLSSIESPLSEQISKEYLSYAAVSYVDDHSPAYSIPQQLEVSRSCGQVSLRVAWITPDVTEHPVSRFLYSFLSSSADPNVHSTVVGVSENRPTDDWLLSDFACLDRVDAMNYPAQPLSQCVNAIKSLDFDIAVDLAGWTGGNFQAGFLQRIAPVQINYLGYFASTGNTEMDYWLGDENLFPDPMNEWHSESIHRLSRCFIAWQPTEHFPEGRVSVTDAPRGSIKFGCFNHNRKLSDATLNAWGRILECLPEARLVLKAHSASDPGTQTLLRRRMLRQGLNPEQVIWLPLAATHEQHLSQYSELDIALDCFPNGGCTTTCEALWMGVPVITKTGGSYVSRMSTAVLRGAELDNWCTQSTDEYVDMAVENAQHIQSLRSSRSSWREKVRQSPLGDADDLMRHLFASFRALR